MMRTPRSPVFTRDEPSTDAASYQPLNASSHDDVQAFKENVRKYAGEEEKLKPWHRRRAAMVCLWLTGTMLLLWFATLLIRPVAITSSPTTDGDDGKSGFVGSVKEADSGAEGGGTLPPPLAAFTDEVNFIWTVNTTGNVSSSAFWYTCKTVDQAVMKVNEYKTGGKLMHVHRPYYFEEEDYLDPADVVEVSKEEEEGVCEKTMTYVLGTDGQVAGMGPSLMGLWLAYGLAKHEGREFFVDDSEWAYGPLSTYFTLPPPPSCKPPPKKWQTPCPHQSRHLIVAHTTTHWVFGHTFVDRFEDPKQRGVFRQKPIYDMMRAGYLAYSTLSQNLVSKLPNIEDKEKKAVAVHVRRGDVNPKEYEYSKGWLPLQRYLRFAFNETVESEFAGPQMPAEGLPHYPADYVPKVYMASDDNSVFTKDEVPDLISKGKLEPLGGYRLPYGFTKDGFENMSLEERKKLGEGYVVDMKGMEKVLVEGKGWAVCDLQASMCRILAVAMGWELAIEHEHWVNIDGQFAWYGVNWN